MEEPVYDGGHSLDTGRQMPATDRLAPYPSKYASVINVTVGSRGKRNATPVVVLRQPPRQICQDHLIQEDSSLE